MSASNEPLDLLERAAELRAAGTPWADAAAQLSLAHDELRRLVSGQSRDYERLARRARDRFRREAVAEAVAALRRLVNGPDTRAGLSAATTLVRYELALMRHDEKEAGARLDREVRRDLTRGAENLRARNTSESAEVAKPQGVAASRKPAHSNTPPVPPTPAAVTPPTATTPAKPAAPTTTNARVAPDERERRRRLLLNDFVHGRGAPLAKDDRIEEEVSRIVDGLLADAKVDDAPPG